MSDQPSCPCKNSTGNTGIQIDPFYIRNINHPKAQEIQLPYHKSMMFYTNNQGTISELGRYKRYPVFNNDHQFYTPSFVLQPEKIKIENNLPRYLASFQEQMSQSQECSETQTFFVPKPPSNLEYCSVCKSYFENYSIHIKMDYHKQSIRENKYSESIIRLCKQFNNKDSQKEQQNTESGKQTKNITKRKYIKKQKTDKTTTKKLSC